MSPRSTTLTLQFQGFFLQIYTYELCRHLLVIGKHNIIFLYPSCSISPRGWGKKNSRHLETSCLWFPRGHGNFKLGKYHLVLWYEVAKALWTWVSVISASLSSIVWWTDFTLDRGDPWDLGDLGFVLGELLFSEPLEPSLLFLSMMQSSLKTE